jgi:hypothetical protein
MLILPSIYGPAKWWLKHGMRKRDQSVRDALNQKNAPINHVNRAINFVAIRIFGFPFNWIISAIHFMEMKKNSDSYYHASYMCLRCLAMQNIRDCSFESNKRWNTPPNLTKSLTTMNICSINKMSYWWENIQWVVNEVLTPEKDSNSTSCIDSFLKTNHVTVNN